MNFRAFVPNFFTCMNLVCGCVGITFAISENLVYASLLIGIAALFDFLDGFAARILNGASELGKQLDSLADMVTFGALPGIIIYQLTLISLKDFDIPFGEREMPHILLAFTSFLIPVFSAIRLAKFNLDDRQKEYFLGLPTPATAIFIASLPLILGVQYDINFCEPPEQNELDYRLQTGFLKPFDLTVVKILFNPFFYIAVSVVLSVLMVVEIPLLALKFKSWQWQRNKTRYALTIISASLISTVYYTELFFLVIPMIIFLYILVSTLYYRIQRI